MSRTPSAESFIGSVASLMRCATSEKGRASSTSTVPSNDIPGIIRYRGSARHQRHHPPRVVGTNDPRPLYTPFLQSLETDKKVGKVLLVFGLDVLGP